MAILGMEIIAWTIEVRRHDRAIVAAILAIIALTHFNACNLRNCIRLIGRLQRCRSTARLPPLAGLQVLDKCTTTPEIAGFEHRPDDLRE